MADEIADKHTGNEAYQRKGAARLVRGAACYVDDLQLPDTAYAAFVRSSAARAKISRLDLNSARDCPGVLAVVASAEITGDIRSIRGAAAARRLLDIPVAAERCSLCRRAACRSRGGEPLSGAGRSGRRRH